MEEKIPTETNYLETNQSMDASTYSSRAKKFHKFMISMILLFSALPIAGYFFPELMGRDWHRSGYASLVVFATIPIGITIIYLVIYLKYRERDDFSSMQLGFEEKKMRLSEIAKVESLDETRKKKLQNNRVTSLIIMILFASFFSGFLTGHPEYAIFGMVASIMIWLVFSRGTLNQKIRCSNCNHYIPSDSKLCPYCGKTIFRQEK